MILRDALVDSYERAVDLKFCEASFSGAIIVEIRLTFSKDMVYIVTITENTSESQILLKYSQDGM